MNKENAHLFLPLVQALADGKIIQRKLPHCKFRGTNLDGTTYLVDSPEEWVDASAGGFAFHNAPEFYRIKPEACAEAEEFAGKVDVLKAIREEDAALNNLTSLPEGIEIPVELYGNPETRLDPHGVFVAPHE